MQVRAPNIYGGVGIACPITVFHVSGNGTVTTNSFFKLAIDADLNFAVANNYPTTTYDRSKF